MYKMSSTGWECSAEIMRLPFALGFVIFPKKVNEWQNSQTMWQCESTENDLVVSISTTSLIQIA